jgi:hypothetical protein
MNAPVDVESAMMTAEGPPMVCESRPTGGLTEVEIDHDKLLELDKKVQEDIATAKAEVEEDREIEDRTCELCDKEFKNAHGLAIHNRKMH